MSYAFTRETLYPRELDVSVPIRVHSKTSHFQRRVRRVNAGEMQLRANWLEVFFIA